MSIADLLSSVRQRESGGNYTLTPQQNFAYPLSHASGAYQFQPSTWQELTAQSGIGTQYSQAYLAPPAIQDSVATYAATNFDPNSSFLWGASAPSGGYVTSSSSPTVSSTLTMTDPNAAIAAADPNAIALSGGTGLGSAAGYAAATVKTIPAAITGGFNAVETRIGKVFTDTLSAVGTWLGDGMTMLLAVVIVGIALIILMPKPSPETIAKIAKIGGEVA